MGYSICIYRFCYIEWFFGGYKTNKAYDRKLVIGCEMYDYEKDLFETENLVDKPEYQLDQKNLEKLFAECIQREFKTCANYSNLADYKNPINTDSLKAKGKQKTSSGE